MANPSVSNRASDLLPTGGPCSIQSSSMLLLQRESPITQVWRPLRRACVKVTITSKQDMGFSTRRSMLVSVLQDKEILWQASAAPRLAAFSIWSHFQHP